MRDHPNDSPGTDLIDCSASAPQDTRLARAASLGEAAGDARDDTIAAEPPPDRPPPLDPDEFPGGVFVG